VTFFLDDDINALGDCVDVRVVSIRMGIDDSLDSRLNQTLGAIEAGLMSDISGGSLGIDSVLGALIDSVLLGVNRSDTRAVNHQTTFRVTMR